jgi:hypothetical protein
MTVTEWKRNPHGGGSSDFIIFVCTVERVRCFNYLIISVITDGVKVEKCCCRLARSPHCPLNTGIKT